jgi:hypothetical protein
VTKRSRWWWLGGWKKNQKMKTMTRNIVATKRPWQDD